MKKYIVLSLLLFFVFQSNPPLFGQERIVHGQVTTFDSIPLIKASIMVKSTKKVVLSDTAGLFTVQCSTRDQLKVTANGFLNQKVKLDSNTKVVLVNLTLKIGEKNREYAIGYGHVSDRDKLYAMSELNTDNHDFSNYRTMYDLINGKFSGVQIISGEIIIRGRSTFTSSNAALIVIDGITTDYQRLWDLPPSEVQSINILKDASSAIYGSRGANGVVLIETKRAIIR